MIESRTETLRQAINHLGSSTSRELYRFTGLDVSCISALLTSDVKKGRLVKGWRGKERCYGLPGSIETPDSVEPYSRYKPKPIHKPVRPVLETRPRLPLGVVNKEYRRLSQLAKSMEKLSNFKNARAAWLAAANTTTREENTLYRFHRADFCQSAVKYGWEG